MKQSVPGNRFCLILIVCLSVMPASIVGAAEADYPALITAAAVKPSKGGALQLLMRDNVKTLCDSAGNKIQLRGMSTHGLQWYPQIINQNAFATLSSDWGANVIRLAMYVNEEGYASDPSVKNKLIEGIKLAIANDMYVIVDWHVLSPGNPADPVYAGALEFFRDIAARFPDNPHILYELCNEPNGGASGVTNDEDGWQAVKDYAEPIIKMLRKGGNKNIILVGSPNWSQRPDLAADNPIKDEKTMYTVHFYTGTHFPNQSVWNNVESALAKGVAVFATEWGTSQASGNNGPYLDEADAWIDYLNRSNVSWCNWSLTNKNETSGAFMPFRMNKNSAASLDPGRDTKWDARELNVSGEYVRARIRGTTYEPIDRTEVQPEIVHSEEGYPTFPSDYEDSTRQYWSWFSSSAVQTALTVEMANGSKALSWEVAYPEVKPEGAWESAPRLMVGSVNVTRGKARYLVLDLYLKPVKASKGALNVMLALAPPELGYWAQAVDPFVVSLKSIQKTKKTKDGLYRFKVWFDLEKLKDGKILGPDTVIRDITLVVSDDESDFAGRMYIDNVRLDDQFDPLGK